MSSDGPNDTTVYKVLVNHEEQYSIWPADRENPRGYREIGTRGSHAECQAVIERAERERRPPDGTRRVPPTDPGASN